jgi:hypothetical protein
MIKYYPLTQITPNLYTSGKDFVNPDGTPYVGRYYMTYDGKTYTGINPVVGTNVELSPVINSTTLGVGITVPLPDPTYTTAASKNSVASKFQSKATLTELTPYYPFPISSDYAKGYFTRYFAKNPSGPGYVIEISQEDWSLIQNGQVENNVVGYETIDMLWQLTGPLNDTRVSQYQIIGGVYDTNKRVTEAKQKGFRGIVEYIGGEYTKFARITS